MLISKWILILSVTFFWIPRSDILSLQACSQKKRRKTNPGNVQKFLEFVQSIHVMSWNSTQTEANILVIP